jgi:uncharacterized protein (TIGR03437 family)
MAKIYLSLVLNTTWVITLAAQSSLAVSVPTGEPVQYTFSLTHEFSSVVGFTAATVDAAGNVYFAGSTGVPLPTTPGVLQGVLATCPPIPSDRTTLGRPGCSWAFVGKLSPEGTLVWLTYVPEPNGNSRIGKIAVDGAGNVYLAGAYETVDNLPSAFPVTPGSFETTPQGTSGTFLAKLNSSGSKLVWATYFNNVNGVGALYPDTNGNLYLGMGTEKLVDLPLINPLSGMAPSIESGYLAKLNAAGSRLLFATWVNAPSARSGIGALTSDASGDLYVTGGCFYELTVADPCVPTTPGALQGKMAGSSAMYAMKLKPDGTLVYSTLLSGSGTQGAVGIATDAAGNLVLAGAVDAAGLQQRIDFPITPTAFQTANTKLNRGTPSTGFVAKLDASGAKLLYSTYFGGSSYDGITGFALDSLGNPVFSGYSYSPDLPVTPDAWQPCHPAPDFDFANGAEADFVGKLTADGRNLSYGSFVGPGSILPDGEAGSSLRLFGMDRTGDLYLIGSQSGFPAIVRYRMIPRPKGSAACVANATHGYASAVAPLELIRVRGNGIAGARSLSPTLTTGGRLPLSFEGLQLFIGLTPASLFAIGTDQITVLAPSPFPANGSAQIRVVQGGLVTAELDCPAQSVAPAIITTDGSGFGSAAALNQDGSVNTHDNPAAPGSVVSVYLTGLGLTNPPLEAGHVATASGSLQTRVQVALRNSSAEILYAGPAPGLLAGIYQINFRVPATGLVDWAPLAVKADVQASQSQSGNGEVGIYVSCPAGSTCARWP